MYPLINVCIVSNPLKSLKQTNKKKKKIPTGPWPECFLGVGDDLYWGLRVASKNLHTSKKNKTSFTGADTKWFSIGAQGTWFRWDWITNPPGNKNDLFAVYYWYRIELLFFFLINICFFFSQLDKKKKKCLLPQIIRKNIKENQTIIIKFKTKKKLKRSNFKYKFVKVCFCYLNKNIYFLFLVI